MHEEQRTSRDGRPFGVTPASDRRARRAKALEPLVDGVRQLEDSFDAMATAVQNWEPPASREDVRPPNPIDAAIPQTEKREANPIDAAIPEPVKPTTNAIDAAVQKIREASK